MADGIVASLQGLGFSDYEARAYVALVQGGALNGYEVAKASRVPRPNVYGVLEKLVARGAATRADLTEGTRFTAVEPRELIGRIRVQHAELTETVGASLEALARPADRPLLLNVEGRATLLEQVRAAIAAAQTSLLCAVWPNEAAELASAIAAAEARGIAITTLCLAACTAECGGCRGKLYRYRTAGASGVRTLIAVADNRLVVAGQVDGDGAYAVRTVQPLVVELATTYVRNAIALAALVADAGARLDELATPDTRALLDALGPGKTEMIFPGETHGTPAAPASR